MLYSSLHALFTRLHIWVQGLLGQPFTLVLSFCPAFELSLAFIARTNPVKQNEWATQLSYCPKQKEARVGRLQLKTAALPPSLYTFFDSRLKKKMLHRINDRGNGRMIWEGFGGVGCVSRWLRSGWLPAPEPDRQLNHIVKACITAQNLYRSQ